LQFAYVKSTTVRAGKKIYRYLTLVESYRDGARVRQRVVARLGEEAELLASGELGRIVDALSGRLGRQPLPEVIADSAPAFGGVAAVGAYFSRLDLGELFKAAGAKRRARLVPDAVLVMVANRLLLPSSKRRAVTAWLGEDVALPEGVSAPSLDQCYRALDVIAEQKDKIETHCYCRLTDLTNLDLRLCCYDLTSSYLEGDPRPPERFPSKAFSYSRDHRGDRPQVVIGLLVTGDGIPIAHHVFPGNTADAATLEGVMDDLQSRFGVGKIALVCDRGLINEENLASVAAHGFDHVIATRLHRDPDVAAVLEAAAKDDVRWTEMTRPTCSVAEVVHETRRHVVVSSPERKARDDHRREELLRRTEEGLIALANRVRDGRLRDPAKIGAAADRILSGSGVVRCFSTKIAHGVFSWSFDEAALRHEEELLTGRYVLLTSLSREDASAVDVVRHYRSLERVERRFRVLKDFLGLRPIFHFTEKRVRGHIVLCVLAAVIEAVMARDLETHRVMDPDLPEQHLTPRRALRELGRIRAVHLVGTDGVSRQVITRPSPFQAQILGAFGIDTSTWSSKPA
jgi:transposase